MKGRKKMTNRLKERFQRFMIGRYGMDQLGQFMAYVVLALVLLNFIIRAPLPSRIMGVLEFAGSVLMYGRMFSKNINKRSKENQAFLRRMFYVTEYLKKLRFQFEEGRKYRIFKCPGCGQKVRVPRGHGKISIHCPKCGEDFIKKS